MKIKKNDKVQVISGKDKGKTGIVTKILVKENKCIVDQINISIVHVKPTKDKEGQLKSKEMPIAISNIALIDNSTNQVSKVGIRFINGKKERFFKKTGLKVDGQ